jgi:hypothetical protein
VQLTIRNSNPFIKPSKGIKMRLDLSRESFPQQNIEANIINQLIGGVGEVVVPFKKWVAASSSIKKSIAIPNIQRYLICCQDFDEIRACTNGNDS